MKARYCLPMLSIVLLAACAKPQPPETERPPEPQATALREAIAQPLEKAQAAKAAVESGAERAELQETENAAK